MEYIKVLCTLRFTESQLDKLRRVSPRLIVEQKTCRSDDDVVAALDSDVQVLYTFYTGFPLEKAPRLCWVQLHSAGANHTLETPLWQNDIPITTSSGIHAVPIAEYVFASILAFSHHVPRMIYYQQRAEWPKDRWAKFVPGELRGQTLGILGYGSIGREVARLAKAFGMRVLAMKRDVSDRRDHGWRLPGTGDPEGRLPDRYFGPEALHDMLSESDFVVVTVPLTGATRQLMGAAEFEAMKRNAYLVNISRGEVVDQAALVAALRKGQIAGAGLDVFDPEPLPADSPLWTLDNVILSPHVSGFTPHYDDWVTDLFADNLRRWLAGEELLNLVDRRHGY